MWMLLTLLACGSLSEAPTPSAPVALSDREVTVGCGMCMFGQMANTCEWAVEIDGEVYPGTGALPPTEDAHEDDGMCNVRRQATVSGKLQNGAFLATKFELHDVTEADRERSQGLHSHD